MREGGGCRPWDASALGALAAAYERTEHDREAKEAVAKLQKLDPSFTLHLLQLVVDAHDDPTFKTELARIIESLRKAGLPEGQATSN